MATRMPLGRQYGYSALPNDLVTMESLDHEIAEGQPDPRGYELWSQDNEKLGTIRGLFGSPSTEKAYFVLVDGSILGGKHYIIPLESLNLDAANHRAYGMFTKADFAQGPAYQANSRDFGQHYRYWSRFGGDRMTAAEGQSATTATTRARDMDAEVRVPITEEEAQVRKEQHVIGHVALRKRVEMETRHISEPVTRTHVEVERHAVPAGQQRDYAADTTTLREGETLRVPVIEEQLIVEKVPRVTEEVILRKETETRQAEQDVQLRRERVEVDEDDEVDLDTPARAGQPGRTRP